MGMPSIGGVGAPVMAPISTQNVQSTGSDALATAVGATTVVVRLCSDATGYFRRNAAATSSAGARLPADCPEYIQVNGGDVIHWISASGTANLNVTEVA